VSESAPGKSHVWAEIREPEMVLEQEGENQQTVVLKSVNLAWNPAESRYESEYAAFMKSGKYSLFFYAKGENGVISPFVKESLYKAEAGMPGDVNDDGAAAGLADAILALKIVCAADLKEANISVAADTDGDKKIGIHEVLYILRKLAGL